MDGIRGMNGEGLMVSVLVDSVVSKDWRHLSNFKKRRKVLLEWLSIADVTQSTMCGRRPAASWSEYGKGFLVFTDGVPISTMLFHIKCGVCNDLDWVFSLRFECPPTTSREATFLLRNVACFLVQPKSCKPWGRLLTSLAFPSPSDEDLLLQEIVKRPVVRYWKEKEGDLPGLWVRQVIEWALICKVEHQRKAIFWFLHGAFRGKELQLNRFRTHRVVTKLSRKSALSTSDIYLPCNHLSFFPCCTGNVTGMYRWWIVLTRWTLWCSFLVGVSKWVVSQHLQSSDHFFFRWLYLKNLLGKALTQ